MKLRTFAITTGLLGAGLAALIVPGRAQGPLWDVVHVNMPYTVTLGDKTLQPGEYTIQQNRDPGAASRVLLIYSNNGMKFETSAMTIPVVDPNTARDTKVVLHHIGPDYYFDKIWIVGKDYGYEFPLPSRVKDREKELQMSSVTVPAEYSTTKSQPATSTANAEQSTQPSTTEPQTAATTVPPPQNATPPENSAPPETAQSSPPPNPPQTTTPPDTSANSANREIPDNSPAATPRTMPSTSAGWLMMLLGGGSLSGLGMALRRKQ